MGHHRLHVLLQLRPGERLQLRLERRLVLDVVEEPGDAEEEAAGGGRRGEPLSLARWTRALHAHHDRLEVRRQLVLQRPVAHLRLFAADGEVLLDQLHGRGRQRRGRFLGERARGDGEREHGEGESFHSDDHPEIEFAGLRNGDVRAPHFRPACSAASARRARPRRRLS